MSHRAGELSHNYIQKHKYFAEFKFFHAIRLFYSSSVNFPALWLDSWYLLTLFSLSTCLSLAVLGLLVAPCWLLLWSLGSGVHWPRLQSSGSAAGARGSAAPQQVGSLHMVPGLSRQECWEWIAIPLSSGLPRFDRIPHCDLSNLGDPTRQWLIVSTDWSKGEGSNPSLLYDQ